MATKTVASIRTFPTASPAESPDWLEIVRQQAESLRFGEVRIVIHDHKITQIERTEKTRFDSARSVSPKQTTQD